MAREARKLSSKGLYYIELRGKELFRTDADKERFLETAKKAFSDGGKIYSYSLTKTGIKMVVKESVKGISMTMKTITVSYARYFNKTHGGEGSIFSDRFKSIPFESKKEADAAAAAISDSDEVASAKTEKKAAPKPTSKKPAKAAEKKAEVKPTAPEKKEDAPKPKKKNLPTWLL